MKGLSKMKKTMILAAFAAGIAMAFYGLAPAKDLPKTVAWTAYNVKSTGYVQAAAIGNAMAKSAGITLRVIPAGNDIARMAPLRTGQAQFSAMGVGAYIAQEAVQDFANPDWGPQPVRMLMASWADTNTGNAATAKDANIKTPADLRGKRVAWVVGSPALNSNMAGFLAFGGLTWKDVTKVEFPGFGQAIKGLVNNQVDAAIASTDSAAVYELESSPRGIHWPETPPEDKAGWERMNKVAPWYAPHVAIAGAGLSRQHPQRGASYGYPILITYLKDEEMVYQQTKLMVTLYDQYKGAHPGAIGWALDRQVFSWILPYHEGAIRYFKEIGVWKPEHQKRTDELIARQNVLKKAWDKAKAERGDKSKSEFAAHWMKVRSAELKAALMDPIWEE